MPKAYGDVRVKGIDVWQVVQPNAGAQSYGCPRRHTTTYCGGGTPTAFVPLPRTFFCTAGNDPQNAMQKADYSGVKLDSDKRTTVSVYINTVVAPPGDPNLPINVELSGTSNGKSLGDPLVAAAPTPQASNFAVAVAEQARTMADQVQFLLPPSWDSGERPGADGKDRLSEVGLRAHVRRLPVPGSQRPARRRLSDQPISTAKLRHR